ncbi:MAG: hypothetical protein HOQ05_13500 [Corynebacteriales bacterium]|nr:hypothetical protein [Mycobacteriales bacterium]
MLHNEQYPVLDIADDDSTEKYRDLAEHPPRLGRVLFYASAVEDSIIELDSEMRVNLLRWHAAYLWKERVTADADGSIARVDILDSQIFETESLLVALEYANIVKALPDLDVAQLREMFPDTPDLELQAGRNSRDWPLFLSEHKIFENYKYKISTNSQTMREIVGIDTESIKRMQSRPALLQFAHWLYISYRENKTLSGSDEYTQLESNFTFQGALNEIFGEAQFISEPGGGARGAMWLGVQAGLGHAVNPLLALDERSEHYLRWLGENVNVAEFDGGTYRAVPATEAKPRQGINAEMMRGTVIETELISHREVRHRKLQLRESTNGLVDSAQRDVDLPFLAKKMRERGQLRTAVLSGITKNDVNYISELTDLLSTTGKSPLLLHFEFASWRSREHADLILDKYVKNGPVNSIGANLEELRYFFNDPEGHPVDLAQKLLLEYNLNEVTIHEREWACTVFRQGTACIADHEQALMMSGISGHQWSVKRSMDLPAPSHIAYPLTINEEYFDRPLHDGLQMAVVAMPALLPKVADVYAPMAINGSGDIAVAARCAVRESQLHKFRNAWQPDSPRIGHEVTHPAPSTALFQKTNSAARKFRC